MAPPDRARAERGPAYGLTRRSLVSDNRSMHIALTRAAAAALFVGPAGRSRASLCVGLRRALVHHGPRHRAPARADAAAVREAPRAGGAAGDRSRHLAQRGLRGGVPESFPGPRLGGLRQGSRTASCRATSPPLWPSSGASASARPGRCPGAPRRCSASLRRAFENLGRRGAFGQYDVVMFSAWLSHYVSDAHQPFHAVFNYDGQLTKQWGIHTRYEAILFERFNQQLTVAPKPQAPIANPRDFIFERVIEGTRLVPAILAADLAAVGRPRRLRRRLLRGVLQGQPPRLRAPPRRIDQRRGGDDRRRVGSRGQAAAARQPRLAPQRRRRS